MSYTARTVILDIANNWGDSEHIGLLAIDFWYQGTKIEVVYGGLIEETWATTYYAPSTQEFDYLPEYAFDTSTPKTGTIHHCGWHSDVSNATNQRLLCVFFSPITFDEIRINNSHSFGADVSRGAKDVKIWISSDAIIDTTYNGAISNSELVFDGQFEAHVASDIEDEQTLVLRETPSYHAKSVIFTAADNHGSGSAMRVRQVDFYLDGTKLDVGGTVTASYHGHEVGDLESFGIANAFDVSTSKTGTLVENGYQILFADISYNTSCRIAINFDEPQTFDTIVINNGHNSGLTTDTGFNNVEIQILDEDWTGTFYDTIGGIVIYDGVFYEHVASDVIDEQTLVLGIITPPTVTYDGNGNESGTVPVATVYEPGDTVTVADNTGAMTKAGYKFSGWALVADSTFVEYAPSDTFTIGMDGITLYAVWILDTPELTVKSIILDIKNNYGDIYYVGIRSVDLYSNGQKIPLTEANGDFVTYHSSMYFSHTHSKYAFDTSVSKIGVDDYASWSSNQGLEYTTNQRIICVLTTPQVIDQIRINNWHNGQSSGISIRTEVGAKDVAVSTTPDTITDTTYGAAVSNGTRIFLGQLDKHVEVNVEDEQILPTDVLYAVIYDGNGATSGTTEDTTYDPGTIVTVVDQGDLVNPSYIFTGWNTEPDGSGTSYSEDDTFLMPEADVFLYAIWVDDPSYGFRDAKSVVFDIADNYGGAAIGLRSVEFFWLGAKLEFSAADFDSYATSSVSAFYAPGLPFDTSKSKTGTAQLQAWSSDNIPTNQRLIVVFGTPIQFDEMVINNYHTYGQETTKGAQNVVVQISTGSYTDTTYGEFIGIPSEDDEKIFEGVFPEHIASDVIDDWDVPITPAVLKQFGFRFRNDDGSEETATWNAAQNTGVALAAGSEIRLRTGVDFISTYPETKSFQLEFRHKPADGVFSGWGKVK